MTKWEALEVAIEIVEACAVVTDSELEYEIYQEAAEILNMLLKEIK